MEGNLREREEGREGREIFFHCMPAAALISWSILVNSFRAEADDGFIKGEKNWKVFFSNTYKSTAIPTSVTHT